MTIARSFRVAAGLLTIASIGAGCAKASEVIPDPTAALPESVRGGRYCEVLLAFVASDAIEAEVWGTQGLNDCPAADWASVDPEAVRAEFGATAVVLNGPRYWVLDRAEGELPGGEPRLFGTLALQPLAALTVEPGSISSIPYVERTVQRDAEFEFYAGSEIYELLAPDGSAYVMQSYAQIVDPSLSESDLSGLGTRLILPAGWQYRARTLAEALVVRTPGEATVVQDELQNTYSRTVDGG
jgi:hypothetical protein